MKTRHPQISQITQMLREGEVCGLQGISDGPFLPNLCNLRNLRLESFKDEL
jgi:hypothetical protein